MKKNINMDLCVLKKDGGYKLNKEACIERCAERYKVYRSNIQEKYAGVNVDGQIKEYDMQTEEFKRDVRNFIREESGLDYIDNQTVKGIIDYLSDKTFYDEPKKLASRAYYDLANDCIYIDMCDGCNVISISKAGITKMQRPIAMFKEYLTDKPLTEYIEAEASKVPSIIQKITRLSWEDAVILTTYMVACLYGNSKPVPILFITGPMGSSKTSLSRLIKDCIDPSEGGMFALSENLKDIAIAASKRLLCVFDNTGGLKNKKKLSDLLCTVVTKGSMQMRTLYTTKDETVLQFCSNIVINGIDYLAEQCDLLNRCIMIELDTIPEEERKTEKQMDIEIKKAMPELLGGLYAIMMKTLVMDDIAVSKLNRMADYELLAIKAAVAMGISAEEFQNMLNKNIQNMQYSFAMSDITVKALVMLMANQETWEGSMSELHIECYNILNGKVLKSELAAYPQNESAFSRHLKGIEKLMVPLGITFKTKKTNKNMQITVSRE